MQGTSLFSIFSDKVADSQKTYRHLLKAMSEPGLIIDIDTAPIHKQNVYDSIYNSTWAVAQTLLDSDCTVYLSPLLGGTSRDHKTSFCQSISFHTDAKITYDLAEADFAFLTVQEFNREVMINQVNKGTIEEPHLSCTFVVQASSLANDSDLYLSGPGIKDSRMLAIADLTREQMAALQENHQLYPMGIDFIFCAPQSITAIPRSTSILSSIKEDA